MTATALYRAFDVNDELLYVGISTKPKSRIYTHRSATPWWRDSVKRVDIEWYADVDAASRAELRAIYDESPKWNRAGVSRTYSRLSLRATRSATGHSRPVVFLGIADIAERTGLSLNTVKAYSQDTPRLIPNPDAMIGRVKGWKASTIDAWVEAKRERAER